MGLGGIVRWFFGNLLIGNSRAQHGKNPQQAHDEQHGQHGRHWPAGAPALTPSAENGGSFLLQNGVRLEVRLGDIADMRGGAMLGDKCDVLTTMARMEGKPYPSARTFELSEQLRRLPSAYFTMESTSGKDMPFSYVFYAGVKVCMDQDEITPESFEDLVDTYSEVLDLAPELQFTSLVTSLLGSREAGDRLEDCVRAAVVAFSDLEKDLIATITIVERCPEKAELIKMLVMDCLDLYEVAAGLMTYRERLTSTEEGGSPSTSPDMDQAQSDVTEQMGAEAPSFTSSRHHSSRSEDSEEGPQEILPPESLQDSSSTGDKREEEKHIFIISLEDPSSEPHLQVQSDVTEQMGEEAPSFTSSRHHSSRSEDSEQGPQDILPPESLQDSSSAGDMREEGETGARISLEDLSSESPLQGVDSQEGRPELVTSSPPETAETGTCHGEMTSKSQKTAKEMMPRGLMSIHRIPRPRLQGFSPPCGTICIEYRFTQGIQREDHPAPGQPFYGSFYDVYLPDNEEGRHIMELLKEAYDRKLTFRFRLVESESDQRWIVEPVDILRKTHHKLGTTKNVKPDPDHLRLLRQDLESLLRQHMQHLESRLRQDLERGLRQELESLLRQELEMAWDQEDCTEEALLY